MGDDRIRVLHVCDHLGWEGSRMHGVKRLFSWMIPRFDPTRFVVSLVSLRKKDLSEEPLERHGVAVTYLHRRRFDPLTLPALLRVVDRDRIDILHLHGYGATTFGRLAGALRRLPTIVHEHCNLSTTPWYQKLADQVLAPWTDVALAVSRSTAEFLVRARRCPPEKVRVVYLGAPLEEFGRMRTADEIAGTRRALGLLPGDIAIGTVTRLQEQKGNIYLVEAARRVLDARPHARFFLVGEGPLRDRLEQRARALKLGGRFVFLGFVTDVASVLAAFDVSVFPSLWEGTPLTLFEALAAGKPIVATDADGLAEVLTEGYNALLVPRRDPDALAARIIWAIDHPDARARLAAAARATAPRYDIARFVQKMEQLYEKLYEVRRSGRRRGLDPGELAFLGSDEPPQWAIGG